MNQATSNGETNTSSSTFQDKLSLSVSTASTSRVLLHYSFEIKQSSTNNVYCSARVTGSNIGFIGGTNGNNYLEFRESQPAYVRINGTILDVGTHSGTRTYKIQFSNSGTGYSYIRMATLVAIEMTD